MLASSGDKGPPWGTPCGVAEEDDAQKLERQELGAREAERAAHEHGSALAGGALVEPRQRHPEVAVGDPGEPVHLHAPLGHLPEVAAQHHAHHAQQRGHDDGDRADGDRRAGDVALLERGGEDVVHDLADDGLPVAVTCRVLGVSTSGYQSEGGYNGASADRLRGAGQLTP